MVLEWGSYKRMHSLTAIVRFSYSEVTLADVLVHFHPTFAVHIYFT
jgi:hypothetical protein